MGSEWFVQRQGRAIRRRVPTPTPVPVDTLDDGPPHPPVGVTDEPDAPCLIEPLDGPQQSQVPLVHEIGERDAVSAVSPGDRHHETEVGGRQSLSCLAIARTCLRRESNLLLGRE